MRTILKVLVGSKAHGLATPESDNDYRGVFVQPTTELLKIGGVTQQTSWIEGKEDDTSWEIGKFLLMATKCNPTIMEVFKAPLIEANNYGQALRNLFPYVWNSRYVMDAYVGYGLNQRKKFLDRVDGREHKYACAYLRSLYNGWELLSTGTFSMDLSKTPIYSVAKRFKNGDYKMGEVIDQCMYWDDRVKEAYKLNPDKKTDLNKVNEFLLQVRGGHWTIEDDNLLPTDEKGGAK